MTTEPLDLDAIERDLNDRHSEGISPGTGLRLIARIRESQPRLWFVRDTAEDGSVCVTAATAGEAWIAAMPILGIEPDEDGEFDTTGFETVELTEAHIAAMQAEIERWREALHAEEIEHEITREKLDDAANLRDAYEDWADKLAHAIATPETIGEHSDDNNPWANALEIAASKDDFARQVVEDRRVAIEERDDLRKLNAIRSEVEADLLANQSELWLVIANERGDGDPPSPGWLWLPDTARPRGGFWYREEGWLIELRGDWVATDGKEFLAHQPTARAAMKHADAWRNF